MPQIAYKQGRRASVGAYVALALAILLGLLAVRATYNYLLFHALVELLAIAVAVGTFMVTKNFRRYFNTCSSAH